MKQFPPRLFGGKDLIDGIREIGKWCAFEQPFTKDDTVFISLEEHEYLVAQAENKVWIEAAKRLQMAKDLKEAINNSYEGFNGPDPRMG